MSITVYDIIGNIGVTLIVVAYLFINSGRWKSDDTIFLSTNLIGSLLIIVSLTNTFNLASFVIELFWIIITLYGFYKKFRSKNPRSSYVEI